MTGDPARGDILCGFVCGGLSASATVCKQRRPALWGCSKAHTGFGNLQNWGPHLQSSQRGQGTSVMTGIRAAGGGLSEVPAGHVPGVWEVASDGREGGLAGLGEVASGATGLPTNHMLTAPHQRRAPRGASTGYIA